MTKSLKKLGFFDPIILKSIILKKYNISEDLTSKLNINLKKRIDNKLFFIIKNKDMIIYSFMVGLNFLVYNGKSYFFIVIKESMIGFRIGEFLITKMLGSEIHVEKKKRSSIFSY